MARIFPPEETVKACSALAKSLAAVLVQKQASTTPTHEAAQTAQMMQALRQVLDSQHDDDVQASGQHVSPGFLQQGLDQQMIGLLQQDIERQQGRKQQALQEFEKQLQQAVARHAVQSSGQFPPAPPLPPAPHVPDWQMQHAMQQDLERQWAQLSPHYVPPGMVDVAHQLCLNAAQQLAAASAWQHEQVSPSGSGSWPHPPTSVDWHHNLALQQALEASGARMPSYGAGANARHHGIFPEIPEAGMAARRPHLLPGAPSYIPTHPLDFSGVSGPTPVPASGYKGSNGADTGGGGKGGGNRKGASRGNNANTAPNKAGKFAGRPTSGGAAGSNLRNAPPSGDPQSGFDKSLRANLESLKSADPTCVVQVRKINRLGFDSAQVLKAHFCKYGSVDRVLVSHCYAKARNLRFRPSGLGFVVMTKPEEVHAILADGPELQIRHTIDGTLTDAEIRVQAFKPQRDLADEHDDGKEENER
jgi:hypothetical protein